MESSVEWEYFLIASAKLSLRLLQQHRRKRIFKLKFFFPPSSRFLPLHAVIRLNDFHYKILEILTNSFVWPNILQESYSASSCIDMTLVCQLRR